jgi:phosphomannomutase
MPVDLTGAARAWIAGDPDPETRAELTAVLDGGDEAELAERMGGTLRFGTAGIRGVVGAGSNRMNRAVVIRTTAGLAAYLAAARPGSGPVVVGYDGRLSSPTFAEDAIAVLAASGFSVRYFDRPVPTPLVAFAGTRLGATASIVVTASHNPPQDNGYKVYDTNGAQIIPPVDGEIAAAIDAVPPAAAIARIADPWTNPAVEVVGPEMSSRYLEGIAALRSPVRSDLRIVYTPMHGVGRDLAVHALEAAGHGPIHVVPEQAEPDGRFPTVAFPNPEEPGALDLAKALAAELKADLVLANDPDADRLAVCVPVAGGWRTLTGNQIGVLLADYTLQRIGVDGIPIVVNSIVSTPMLASIAAEHGARFEQTLTGFKWICNAALDLEAAGAGRFVFGFEEALGYSVGPLVRDKDGISAAVWFADMTADAAEAGETVLDRLANLYRRHGLWVSIQASVVRPGAEGLQEIAGAIEKLREQQPATLGGRPVVEVADFRDGAAARPRWLGPQALVAFSLEGGGRVLVRPSGTEPKLKVYVDLTGASTEPLEPAEEVLTAQARATADDLLGFLGLDV